MIEVEYLDVLREPSIATKGHLLDNHGITPPQRGSWVLSRPPGTPCVFLEGANCTIYPSRPNMCVAFEPGTDACGRARTLAGLRPLSPPTLPPLVRLGPGGDHVRDYDPPAPKRRARR